MYLCLWVCVHRYGRMDKTIDVKLKSNTYKIRDYILIVLCKTKMIGVLINIIKHYNINVISSILLKHVYQILF